MPTDSVTEQLAGSISSSLGVTYCAETYRYDVRHSIGRAKNPTLAVYCSSEEILENRGERDVHKSTFKADYYLGPVPRDKINDHWATLRYTAGLVIKHLNRDTTILSTSSIESVLPGRVQYGYFQPAAAIDSTAYLGWSLPIEVSSVESEPISGLTDLMYLSGTMTLTASGSFTTASFVEFCPF